MLPEAYRLRRRSDFDRVYRRGKSRACAAFVLYVRRHDGSGARIGFSVSKKIGKAVERNRLKRQFRHAAAGQLALFRPDMDYVFVLRRAAAGLPFSRIVQEMERMIREISL